MGLLLNIIGTKQFSGDSQGVFPADDQTESSVVWKVFSKTPTSMHGPPFGVERTLHVRVDGDGVSCAYLLDKKKHVEERKIGCIYLLKQ